MGVFLNVWPDEISVSRETLLDPQNDGVFDLFLDTNKNMTNKDGLKLISTF